MGEIVARWGARALVVVLCGSVAACAVTAETFPDRYADAVCARQRSCDDTFDERYDDRDACRVQTSEFVWRQLGLSEDEPCPFDDNSAADCLSDIKDTTCDAFNEGGFSDACNAVLASCLDAATGG